MRFRPLIMMVAALMAVMVVADCWAQEPGGRGGRRGQREQRAGGISRLALLRIEAVQKELELIDTQLGDIEKLRTELRGERGERGQRGERGGQRGERGDQRGARGEGSDVSDAERQARRDERQKQAAQRAKLEMEKLDDVLLPLQMTRLNQIFVQVAGVRALEDSGVAEKLKITDAQRKQLAEAQSETREEMRGQMQELAQSGDRDTMREKMAEMRTKADKKVMAVLTDEQRKTLDELKGAPFEMPADAMRGAFGGRQRGGREGQNRPARPRRPSGE